MSNLLYKTDTEVIVQIFFCVCVFFPTNVLENNNRKIIQHCLVVLFGLSWLHFFLFTCLSSCSCSRSIKVQVKRYKMRSHLQEDGHFNPVPTGRRIAKTLRDSHIPGMLVGGSGNWQGLPGRQSGHLQPQIWMFF